MKDNKQKNASFKDGGFPIYV